MVAVYQMEVALLIFMLALAGQLDHNLPIPEEYRDSEVVVKVGKSRSVMIPVNFNCPSC